MIYTASEMVYTLGRGETSQFRLNLVINQLKRELPMKSAICAALEHKSGELQLNIDIFTRAFASIGVCIRPAEYLEWH
jgi:hypothetical protein